MSFPHFNPNFQADAGDDDPKKSRQKRGGKALAKPKKKEVGERLVKLARASRGKKKYVTGSYKSNGASHLNVDFTVVMGLTTFDIDLKDAAKFFASRFACGSSVTGVDEIVIQGDVKDDLFDVITEKWPDIDEDFIEDLGNVKK